MLTKNVSGETFLTAGGIYYPANIFSRFVTASMKANFMAVRSILNETVVMRKECKKCVIIAMTKRDRNFLFVDSYIRKITLNHLAQLNNNNKSDGYKRLFPNHLTGIINLPIIDEINKLKEYLELEM